MPPKASGRALSAAHMRINWKRGLQISVRRILRECGDSVFTSTLTDTPVPLLGTDFVISPEVSGPRARSRISAFFLVTFLSRLHPQVVLDGGRNVPLPCGERTSAKPSLCGRVRRVKGPVILVGPLPSPRPSPPGERGSSAGVSCRGGTKLHVTRHLPCLLHRLHPAPRAPVTGIEHCGPMHT